MNFNLTLIRGFVAVAVLALLVTAAPAFAQSLAGSDIDPRIPVEDAARVLHQDSENTQPPMGDHIPPFGVALFQGGFSNDSEDGLNPGYVVQSGDSVSVRIWGATQFNDRLVVDPQGNIFIPAVGPIRVAGATNANLNQRVSSAVARVFTDNVRVYTNLDSSQPVAVLVTGFVSSPGRYAGVPSNSPLYFLDRAGGVDPRRGSYRNIRIMRQGERIADIDLYDFLLKGVLPPVQFQDGDTIVVEQRGNVVVTDGDVSNSAAFEFLGSTLNGEELISYAQLNVDVNYAGVSGFRSGSPYAEYLPLHKFRNVLLCNGDIVNFRADQHDEVIVVSVEGSYRGPSRYSVPMGTRLNEILDYIEVDQEVANIGSISLRRKAIATRQKQALEEGLQRLEATYLTASSQTDQESAIRANEAELIGRFVARARNVEPSGRLVVAGEGGIANVMLQQGDTITIPPNVDSILLSGEVLVSQAMLYKPNERALDYISRSGGFTPQALTEKVVLLHANGEVSSGKNPVVSRGDEIIVLPKVPVKNLQLASTIVDIIYKVAIAASVALSL